jgi:hypothetical protein
MAVVARWDESARHRQIIRTVKDQQPVLVRAKPALPLPLQVSGPARRLWQSQNAYDRRVI